MNNEDIRQTEVIREPGLAMVAISYPADSIIKQVMASCLYFQ